MVLDSFGFLDDEDSDEDENEDEDEEGKGFYPQDHASVSLRKKRREGGREGVRGSQGRSVGVKGRWRWG